MQFFFYVNFFPLSMFRIFLYYTRLPAHVSKRKNIVPKKKENYPVSKTISMSTLILLEQNEIENFLGLIL
jgi:hypothetical protein